MGTRLVVQRICYCGKPAHPQYGSLCEDCWVSLQPDIERANILRVAAKARKLITRTDSGLYALIDDDGATDPPVRRIASVQIPGSVEVLE